MNKLKGWLKPNELTPDPTDFNILVESFGSAGIDRIISEMVADGMELKPETVRNVVTRYNRKCADMTLRGFNVNTGLVHLRATVRGVFFDKKWDPKRHSVYISITKGQELRTAAANTTVDIMGVHPNPMSVFSATDLSTGASDGTLTRGFNAEVRGTYIKIAGDDPACGLYLRNAETGEDTKLEQRFIAVNDPSRIMFIVPPDMPEGAYELRIVTQFTTGKPLKNTRSASLAYNVEIV